MLARELMKIALCAVAGLILGLAFGKPEYIPFAMLYVIGIVYSAKVFLPKLWGWFKATMATAFGALLFSGFFPALFALFVCLLGVWVILVVAWIAGVILAIISIFRSAAEDRKIGRSTSTDSPSPEWPDSLPSGSQSSGGLPPADGDWGDW